MIETKLVLDLQFFNAESEGKTEKATPKKREDARKEGQVAKSNEINTAFILLTFFGVMKVASTSYINSSKSVVTDVFSEIPRMVTEYSSKELMDFIGQYLIKVITMNGMVWGAIFVVAFIVCIAQVGWHPTFKNISPKFSKMNPLKGMKKIVSKDSLVELVKSLCKVIFLGVIIVNTVKGQIPLFIRLYDITPLNILNNVANLIGSIGFSISGAYLFIAALDYGYQKYKFEDSIKMSKQDIKDEYKQSEGDPLIKGQIRQKQREMAMGRMMQSVPDADVIITNPTHYAIAIKYDEASGLAPIVVAKGVDHVAQKIKEKAKESNVEIVENRLLARTLYSTVDIGQQIPPELYGAVAEILAFVYSLQNK